MLPARLASPSDGVSKRRAINETPPCLFFADAGLGEVFSQPGLDLWWGSSRLVLTGVAFQPSKAIAILNACLWHYGSLACNFRRHFQENDRCQLLSLTDQPCFLPCEEWNASSKNLFFVPSQEDSSLLITAVQNLNGLRSFFAHSVYQFRSCQRYDRPVIVGTATVSPFGFGLIFHDALILDWWPSVLPAGALHIPTPVSYTGLAVRKQPASPPTSYI